MMPVPNGLDPGVAVLTEPMAIAHHAVNRSEITKKDAAIVIGCGPVGLAVICMLRAKGVETIVASDLLTRPSRPRPAPAAPTWSSTPRAVPLRRARRPWLPDLDRRCSRRRAQSDEGTAQAPAAVAPRVPGPRRARRHRAEAADHLRMRRRARHHRRHHRRRPTQHPGRSSSVCAWNPTRSARPWPSTRRSISASSSATAPSSSATPSTSSPRARSTPRLSITGTVGLDGVANAFDALADPEQHAKIIIDPRSTATAPETSRLR